MFMAIRISWLLPISLSLLLSSCGDFDDPEPLNPKRFYGCYGDGDNQLTISPNGIRFDGTDIPYEIQERKVGYVIVLPAIFLSQNGALSVQSADKHFYRLIDENLDRHIIIADQNAFVHELEFGACA